MTASVRRIICLWIVSGVILTHMDATFALLKAPHIPYEAFVKLGDLNLGALYSARDRSGDVEQPCGGKITQFRLQQNIQAVAYAVELINADSSILPNVTLGYVVLDDCRYGVTTLAKATRFLPVNDDLKKTIPANISHNGKHSNSNIEDTYNVVGVVGPSSSSKSVLVSSLLGMFHIPVISAEATSDELTDSFNHHYFLRVMPPDRFQADAMMALIQHFNWTYFSVLYSEGSYGTNLFRQIQKASQDKDICIGYFQEISQEYFTILDFDNVVKNLRINSNAKVVILVLGQATARGLLSAVKRADAHGEFIWIGSEAFDARSFTGLESEALGAFSLAVPLSYAKDFANHFLQLNPINNPTNPWYKPLWENLFDCTWNPTLFNTTVSCHNFPNISQVNNYFFSNWTSKTIDAVFVYAHALHKLIQSHCNHTEGNQAVLQNCVNGPLLRDYLLQVSFQGMSGHIEFDKNGDLIGNYHIKQLIKHGNSYQQRQVGIWQNKENTIVFNESVKWYLKSFGNGTRNIITPDSVCSYPCNLGQVAIPGELPCCWHCRTCRENEIAQTNVSACFECPYLTWPDSDTFTRCVSISPSYLKWSDLFGIFLAALDTAGLVLMVSFTGIFVNYLDCKIMKASSIPLCIIVIMGLFLAFVTSVVFKGKPDTITCSVSHVGYHISCTLIYATLLVKTSRIFRIFRASKKCQRPRVLMNMTSQITMVFVMVLTQILVIFIAVTVNNISMDANKPFVENIIPSVAELHMPVRVDKLVELRCNRPQLVLLAPLSFNIFLLLLCAVFAFLTRQLPDAFNESWYIFLSVTTTLIIWMAFIPTYFVAFYARYKEALLSLALSLNALCNLVCLFGPKVYALFWVEEENIQMGFDDIASASRITVKKIASTRDGFVDTSEKSTASKQSSAAQVPPSTNKHNSLSGAQ